MHSQSWWEVPLSSLEKDLKSSQQPLGLLRVMCVPCASLKTSWSGSQTGCASSRAVLSHNTDLTTEHLSQKQSCWWTNREMSMCWNSCIGCNRKTEVRIENAILQLVIILLLVILMSSVVFDFTSLHGYISTTFSVISVKIPFITFTGYSYF